MEDKEKFIPVIIIGAILFLGLATIVLTGFGVRLFAIAGGSTFTPVYCNDYEFTCCQKQENTQTYDLTNTGWITCPPDVFSCQVTTAKTNPSGNSGTLYYGKSNCRYQGGFLGLGQRHICDDETSKVVNSGGLNIGIPAGYDIYYFSNTVGGNSIVTVNFIRQRLAFTGRAASGSGGVPISSDSCAFTVSKGSILKDSQNMGTSYTVPIGDCVLAWQSGDRHICGNLEERCDADSDCTGHTYGNKECTGRTLQTYGCKQLSPPSSVALLNGDYQYTGYDNIPGSNAFSGVISRCEITSAVTVQCCGDTDCGSNMACDKNTWTCKPTDQVECTQNSDCGVSTQCDYSTLQLKTPKCKSGKCSYSTVSVDCCSDAGCPINQYCNSDLGCVYRVVIKKQCPFDCCLSMTEYFERTCPTGQFCKENKCQATPGCQNADDCNNLQECVSGECINKNLTCESKVFGLVTSKPGYITKKPFLGLGSTEQTYTCINDYTGVWAVVILLIIIGGVVVGIFFGIAYWKSRQ